MLAAACRGELAGVEETLAAASAAKAGLEQELEEVRDAQALLSHQKGELEGELEATRQQLADCQARLGDCQEKLGAAEVGRLAVGACLLHDALCHGVDILVHNCVVRTSAPGGAALADVPPRHPTPPHAGPPA